MNYSGPTRTAALLSRWMAVVDATPDPVRNLLAAVAERHAAQLADVFYATMLSDTEARRLINQELVAKRLGSTIQRWLIALFSAWSPERVAAVLEQQYTLGGVHARIGVRICLVLYAATVLKATIRDLLQAEDAIGRLRSEACTTAAVLIDHAMEAIAARYESATEQESRDDEAYRIYTATIDLSMERQRQRGAIIDWENSFLHSVMIGGPEESLMSIGSSAFGLWVYHKATTIFDRSEDLRSIFGAIRRIDEEYLPRCRRELEGASIGELRRIVRQTADEVERVKYLLDAMFERILHVESGRDALTKLLNRRFLPAIIGREIKLCKSQNKSFSLLLIDIDHFKAVNDTYGHEAGDEILRQISERLSGAVHSGDFVFRYGGEEFLVLCAELTDRQALLVAERIRNLIASEPFSLGKGGRLDVTVSIGVAGFDGHPDYQQQIGRADQALYRAKNGGRNRTEVAPAATSIPISPYLGSSASV